MELLFPLLNAVMELLTINWKTTENIISKIKADVTRKAKSSLLFHRANSKSLWKRQASHLCWPLTKAVLVWTKLIKGKTQKATYMAAEIDLMLQVK